MVHFLLAVGHDFYLTWWLLKEPLVLLPVEAMSNSLSQSLTLQDFSPQSALVDFGAAS